MTPEESRKPPVDPELIERVVVSIYEEPLLCYLGSTLLPSREAIDELVELLREVFFPGFYGRRGLTHINLPLHVQELLSGVAIRAEEQIRSCLRYASDIDEQEADCPDSIECDRLARETTRAFLQEIPRLRELIAGDVRAAYDGDPAAHHHDETIFCYPGVEAIFCHRIAHFLYERTIPLLPRLIQEAAHSRTGIDIHPGAQIGPSFFIDHGGGVVIGETTVIGEGCRIYQGVTLGAKSFAKDEKGVLLRTGEKRHPTIGDHVTIYAGAVVLGGDTVIGDDCVIAGSVFVTRSVPTGHVVRQKSPELELCSTTEIIGMTPDDEVPAGG